MAFYNIKSDSDGQRRINKITLKKSNYRHKIEQTELRSMFAITFVIKAH